MNPSYVMLLAVCLSLAQVSEVTAFGPGEKPAPGSESTEDRGLLMQLVGRFVQEVKVARGPGVEPFLGTGDANGGLILDGHFVLVDSKVTVSGNPYNSWSIIGYDPRGNSYSLVALDNGSNRTLNASGTYDTETQTLVFEGTRDTASGEVPSRFRLRYQFLSGDTIEVTYEFQYADTPAVEVYRSKLVRQ